MRLIRSLLLCISACSTAPVAGYVRPVLFEYTDAKSLERIDLISQRDFRIATLIEIGSQFKTSVNNRFVLSTLWIVTSRSDGTLIHGLPSTDWDYPEWRRLWLERSRRVFPVARITVINGSGRIEIRMADGSLKKALLSAEDPLVVSSSKGSYEIAHALYTPGQFSKTDFSVYLLQRGGEDSKTADIEIMRELSRRFKSRRIEADFLRDPWFQVASLPVVYPFEAVRVPPEKAINRTWCYLLNERFACNSSGYN